MPEQLSQAAPCNVASPSGRYEVTVDLEGFRELFLAQQRRYEKKSGSTPLADLKARYTIGLCDLGFSEDSATELIRVPWVALREQPVKGERGTYFVVDKGEQESFIHNMIGINWAFRDVDALGVLFVPNEETEANSDLLTEISAAIRQERSALEDDQGDAGEKIAAWLRASGTKA